MDDMLHWRDERSGFLDGVPFRVVEHNFAEAKTTDEEVVVLKPRTFFNHYAERLDSPPRNVLEIGFFEGGSMLLFAAMWPDARIVGIDLRRENAAVLRHIDRLGLTDRVRLHYGVGQADAAAIMAIMDAEIQHPDLIIDDASHLYELSRTTFEVTFPRLAAGAAYVIEDWGWAHWKNWSGGNAYEGQPPLSKLVWELVMTAATSPELIESVAADRFITLVRKARTAEPSNAQLNVSSLYIDRGATLPCSPVRAWGPAP